MGINTLKILAIDDQRDNLITLRAVLTDALQGCTLFTALDGLSGIALARSEDPDAILLDIIMPGMDGFEVCRRLKAEERLRDIPVIFLTALGTDRETHVKALEAGGDAFLAKPANELELVAQLRAMAKLKAAHRMQRFERDELTALVAERTHELELELAERKRVEQALRDSEANYRSLFEHAPIGILIADQQSFYLDANEGMCRLLGYSREELVGLHASNIVAPQIEPAREAIRTSTGYFREWQFVRKDGSTFTAEVAVMKMPNGNLMATVQDITERKRMEAQLAQSDRLSTMGMLAAGVAHEINNPLSYVLFNLESLTDDLPRLGSALRSSLDIMGKRMGQKEWAAALGPELELLTPAMLDDILARFKDALGGIYRIKDVTRGLGTFSRVDETRLLPVNLMDVIELAINMAFNEIKYRARLVKDYGQLSSVLASEGRLSQVFLNLLVNAAHAIDEGALDKHQILVRTWQQGEEVFAEVRDTGRGIAPQNLPRIFEPFYTTKEIGVGTGLGLSISKNIIEGYGGRIEVRSELGKGTSVIVRLPIRRLERAATVEPPIPVEAEPKVRGRILIIDDEDGIRHAMVRMLKGHTVVDVASGEEALKLLESDQRFDLILCDVMMPTLSGVELHEWLAQTLPDLAKQVVFITGGAFTPRAQEYLASVDNPQLEKPFDMNLFRKIVNDHIKNAGH
ncbi:MAG: hypothetical protein CO108_25370 [Deltaproteobacteria bacterium CG_4_9_14_3_um_filter_63_12]|nr:MAG: hypothetical protein CO108_25370 [Deltaproteobacteria bacterium CG_4_9_14_3_um_filter_63_12]